MNVSIELLSRDRDNRGWVSEIYSGGLGAELQNIHLGTMKPGIVRGNHVHRNSREWIVFFEGPVEIHLKQEGDVTNRIIKDPSKISIPSGVAHAFKNIGDGVISFTAYRDTVYDEENPDSEPVELIDEHEFESPL